MSVCSVHTCLVTRPLSDTTGRHQTLQTGVRHPRQVSDRRQTLQTGVRHPRQASNRRQTPQTGIRQASDTLDRHQTLQTSAWCLMPMVSAGVSGLSLSLVISTQASYTTDRIHTYHRQDAHTQQTSDMIDIRHDIRHDRHQT